MPNNKSAAYYSQTAAEHLQQKGQHPAIVQVSHRKAPVLATEVRSVASTFLTSLKSDWDDAVIFFKGSRNNCRTLADTKGQLTGAGKEYCAQNGIAQTREALAAVAIKPR